MKTEFLKGLGLEQDVIDKIMAEHGKGVNASKELAARAQKDLEDARETLKTFEGVDVKDLQQKVATLTKGLEDKQKDHAKEIAAISFARDLDGAITDAKGRSIKAIRAMLDVERLMESKNQKDDIAAALEQVKKEHDYLFEGAAPISRVTGSTPGAATGDDAQKASKANSALRQMLGREG